MLGEYLVVECVDLRVYVQIMPKCFSKPVVPSSIYVSSCSFTWHYLVSLVFIVLTIWWALVVSHSGFDLHFSYFCYDVFMFIICLVSLTWIAYSSFPFSTWNSIFKFFPYWLIILKSVRKCFVRFTKSTNMWIAFLLSQCCFHVYFFFVYLFIYLYY